MQILIILFLLVLPAFAQVHLFNDDTDSRNVGAIEAAHSSHAIHPAIRLLAEHPHIDPVQGWAYPRGLNLSTIHQLETLTRKEGRLHIRVYNVSVRPTHVVRPDRISEVLRHAQERTWHVDWL